MKKLIFAATLLCSTNVFAVGQAFIDGQAAGASVLGRDAGSVTSTNTTALQSINTANPDPAAVSTLQGNFAISNAGNSGLGSFGSQKLTDCANYVPNPATPAKNQECAAVNELAKNPVGHATSVTGINKSDSMFTNPNNMVNQGLSGPAPALAVGSGTPGGNVTGAGACLQTTSSTPPVFTNQTCTRSAVPTPQTCQIALAPTITSTPYCDIAGTAQIISSDPSGVIGAWGATGQPYFNITFGCQSISSGKAVISPFYAGWGVGLYSYSVGGGINIGWYGNTVVFVPGITSTPIGWWSGVNYDGTLMTYTTAWYDGPSNTIRVQSSGKGGSPVTCDAGYTYQNVSYPVSTTSYNFTTKKIAGTINSTTTYTSCVSAQDPATTVIPSVAPTIPNSCRAGWAPNGWITYIAPKYYLVCAPLPGAAGMGTAIGTGTFCPYGFSLRTDGTCISGTVVTPAYEPPAAGLCDANHTYTIFGSSGYCVPNNSHLNNFGQSSPNYTGSAGIHLVLNENIQDSCAQFQATTSTPTAMPATSVAGTLVCPTGKTLSGTNCI